MKHITFTKALNFQAGGEHRNGTSVWIKYVELHRVTAKNTANVLDKVHAGCLEPAVKPYELRQRLAMARILKHVYENDSMSS